ncbi:MAG: SurA N-terminal domain-containing protein [Methylohalobius sp.]|nr:SurA N-terminal domain-containing protein [Methylohalobius sp.]
MLQTIRDRAQGILAWIILILITIPFALWGIGNYFDAGKEKPIAVAGDREFFERDLLRLYEQQYVQLLSQGTYTEQELKQRALNQLIDDELLFQTVVSKKLAVSDAQVANFVRSLPIFQTDGRFDEEKYHRLLVAEGLSSDQFIAQVRRSLLTEQLAQAIIASSFVTEHETEAFYKLQSQHRQISYLILPLPESETAATEQEIQTYYQQHPEQFKTQEQVAIDYLLLSKETLAQGIEPTEEDLQRHYEEQKQAFTTPELRRLRHILIAASPDASDEEKQKALAEAREIRSRIEQGENFSDLAKQFSDDPGSKAQGGDLGFVKKGTLEKNFEETAFALPEGKVSDPVETPFGYHLIQVISVQPASIRPYAEVKEQIRRDLKQQEAETRFYALAEKMAQLAYENPHSLEPVAEALELKVESTALFTREQGEGIAAAPKVREAAFSEEVLTGNNSEPIEIGNESVVVLRVRQHLPAQLRPLSEVQAKIATLLQQQKARQMAEAQAQDWLVKLERGVSLEEIAKHVKAKIETAELTRNTPIPALGVGADIVFQAPRPQADKPVFLRIPLADGRQVLAKLLAVVDGDYASLKPEDKRRLQDNLARTFGLMTFKAYQAQLRDKAKVKIHWPVAAAEQ